MPSPLSRETHKRTRPSVVPPSSHDPLGYPLPFRDGTVGNLVPVATVGNDCRVFLDLCQWGSGNDLDLRRSGFHPSLLEPPCPQPAGQARVRRLPQAVGASWRGSVLDVWQPDHEHGPDNKITPVSSTRQRANQYAGGSISIRRHLVSSGSTTFGVR